MKYDALVEVGSIFEYFTEVPANRFTLSVFVSRDPDCVGFFSGLAELGDEFSFFAVDLVASCKVVVYVDWWYTIFVFLGRNVADMPNAEQHRKIATKNLPIVLAFDGDSTMTRLFFGIMVVLNSSR